MQHYASNVNEDLTVINPVVATEWLNYLKAQLAGAFAARKWQKASCNMLNDKDLSTPKFLPVKYGLQLEDIDKNTLKVTEIDLNHVHKTVNEQIIKWYKFKDKKILSRLSIRQLKKLIKRCEEVIKEKAESEE